MQNKMLQRLSNLGLRVLEKSRAYYFPYSMTDQVGGQLLSNAEFANMLREIERFSAQFPLPESKPASRQRAQ